MVLVTSQPTQPTAPSLYSHKRGRVDDSDDEEVVIMEVGSRASTEAKIKKKL